MDAETKKWVRNPSDELAVARAGCRFDEARGQFVVDWIQDNLRLYEGDFAGQPMTLADWQLDCTLRLFGWIKWSDRWKRWVRRFRQASIWVPKKNGKSPTLAAWGLYLLAGDGEQGQKVFYGAKDGHQARQIAGKHAAEMMLLSDVLSAECQLNKVTSEIRHLATKSVMMPLSSSNSRTKESKEGLNGSVLIDETHVVDEDFVRRISRAGISRSEPLQIEVSTAGNNPDGYGKKRFDYAREVLEGKREDHALFVSIHAAPQDLSDEDLDADPEKWGKLANPTWGRIIDPQEYMEDYRRSHGSLQALLDFKMYRLNIWQRSSNPWLRAGDWEACRDTFSEDSLAGQDCWAALDLSRTRDMSALVLCFRGDGEEEFLLLPYFWLPERRVEELAELAPVREWAQAGFLEVTPGDVTDYGFIRARFRALAAKFNILELAYDPRFAEETTQALEQGTADDQGNPLEEGTGIPRYVFAQNDQNFAAPTEDFERLVLAGTLRHNSHPVLSWQAGHAQIVVRPMSRCKRVVKATKNDYRTVDGVVAAIMALGRAMMEQPRFHVEIW